MPREEATRKFQEINQAFQVLSHWKETGDEPDSEAEATRDRDAGYMDLAEMMMFFEFMMGGRTSQNGRRTSSRRQHDFVDVDMMLNFAFGGRAPPHWGSMEDDDEDDDDYEYDDDDYDDEDDEDDDEDEDDHRNSKAFASSKLGAKKYSGGSRDEARKLTVGELKSLLRERDVDFSGCLEKSEMLALLMDWESAHVAGESPSTRGSTGPTRASPSKKVDRLPKRMSSMETTGDDDGLDDDDDDKRFKGDAAGDNGGEGLSTKAAKRAARKKAQQKRKKERQKAERSAAKGGDDGADGDLADDHDGDLADGLKETKEDSSVTKGLQAAGLAASPSKATNGSAVLDGAGTAGDDDESKLRYSQLRDEVLVDVANAVDAGDARGAASALEAANRVGLEPGGQYRALFEHAARLVTAARDRRDADAERQKAKEEAARRKTDEKRQRREARRKAAADKVEVEERERERREAERRERKAAKKREKHASDTSKNTTASKHVDDDDEDEDDDYDEDDLVNSQHLVSDRKDGRGRDRSNNGTKPGGAATAKSGGLSPARPNDASANVPASKAAIGGGKKSKSKDPKNSESKPHIPHTSGAAVNDNKTNAHAPSATVRRGATAAGGAPSSSAPVAAVGAGTANMPATADNQSPADGGAAPSPAASGEDDLEQLEAEQLRQVLQMSLDQAAKEEEERKSAARAAERAELSARRERERALQREWNSTQRRAAVQQTKAREADARREAELQRASQTAAAVALSGLPGFEDLARGVVAPQTNLGGFSPAVAAGAVAQRRGAAGHHHQLGGRSSAAAPPVAKAPGGQRNATSLGAGAVGKAATPAAVASSSVTPFSVETFDDDDDVLHLAEQSVAGVLDADDDDLFASSGGDLLRDRSATARAPASAGAQKLVGLSGSSSSGAGGVKGAAGLVPATGKVAASTFGGGDVLEAPPSFGGRQTSVPTRQRGGSFSAPDPPRPVRTSSLQPHAPAFSTTRAAPAAQSGGQRQQLTSLYGGAPAPAMARGPSPTSMTSSPRGVARTVSGTVAAPAAPQGPQQRPGFTPAAPPSGSMQSQLLALGGAPLFIPQQSPGQAAPSPPPPGGMSPLVPPPPGAPPVVAGRSRPPPTHAGPAGTTAAPGYPRGVAVVPPPPQGQQGYGAPPPPPQGQQQQYAGVPPRPTAASGYVGGAPGAPQPRWMPTDTAPRGPRPAQGASVVPASPTNLYSQRSLATAQPFVPAHQRGVQPMQATPRPPSSFGGQYSAAPAKVGAVPLGAPPGGLPGAQRSAVAARPPHLGAAGVPGATPVGSATNPYAAATAVPQQRTAEGVQGPSRPPTQAVPAPQPVRGVGTSGLGASASAFEPRLAGLSAASSAASTPRSGLPTTSAARQGRVSPTVALEHPRWSAPAVDDSLRLAMEMSRQSELADALSTLDDAPLSAGLQRPASQDIDARLAAAASSAAEWVPAAVREARAKQQRQDIAPSSIATVASGGGGDPLASTFVGSSPTDNAVERQSLTSSNPPRDTDDGRTELATSPAISFKTDE